MKIYILFSFRRKCAAFLSTLILLSCAPDKSDSEEILAVVDGRKISLNEFRLFYELDPNFGIDSSGIAALNDELFLYVDLILSVKKADSDGLQNNPVLKRALHWEQKNAMLRQLFRAEIESNIRISEAEMRETFKKGIIHVHLRHLFAKNKEEIEYYHSLLQSGKKFKDLATEVFQDTILARNGGDLGWIRLDELDDRLADSAAVLPQFQYSTPIQSQWGYHILEVINRKKDLIVSESEYESKKTALRKKIKHKKSRQLANEYISTFIGQLNPQPVLPTFQLLLNSLVPVQLRESKHYQPQIVVSSQIQRLRDQLQAHLARPLIKYKGGSVSLGEYLAAVSDMPESNRPAFKSPRHFSNQIGSWIRDELLFKKVTDLGLAENKIVEAEVRQFLEEQCYFYYLNEIADSVELPLAVQKHFSGDDKLPRFARFHTPAEYQWWRAAQILHQKLMPFRQDSIFIDRNMLFRENKHINWDRRVRMFMVRNPS